MIVHPLPCGRQTIVDDEDAHLLRVHRWHSQKAKGGTFYVAAVKGRIKIYLHRLIAGSQSGQKTDHRDGDGLNNTRANLRRCSNAENMRNMHRGRGASKFKGVTWFKRHKRWRAYIVRDAQQIHLGYFDDEISAARAYDRSALKLFGDFANLNLPERTVG